MLQLFLQLLAHKLGCVAVIREPTIKRESWSATPISSDSLIVAKAVGCVQVNKHHWCSGFTVFLLTVRGFSSKTPWRRERDSNPRKVALHTLSKRADSAALAPLPGGQTQ